MGVSDAGNLPFVAMELQRLAPRSILEIGVGFGKWGVVAREYLEAWQGRFRREDWQVRIEGVKDDKFVTLAQGTTDASGFFVWKLNKRAEADLRRVIVQRGNDTLVVDPDSAPSEYAKENWSKPDDAWLAWTTNP